MLVVIVFTFFFFYRKLHDERKPFGKFRCNRRVKNRCCSILKIDYMSSDQSASDSSASETEHDHKDTQTDESSTPKKKMLLTKKLPWRSAHLEETLHTLDRKSQRKRSRRASSMLLKRRGTKIASACLAPVGSQSIAVRGSVIEDDLLKLAGMEQFIK